MSLPGLVALELWKMLRRGRSYIGPVGLLAIVVPVAIGLKYGPMMGEIEHYAGAGGGMQVFGSPVNALFLARVVLPPTVFLFLPLFASIVAGDQISGESADGTLRGLLARPISKFKLLFAKYIVSFLYSFGLITFLALSAFIIGWVMFGLGGLVSFGGGVRYFGMEEGLQRLALSYTLGAVYLFTVMSLAFMLSVFMNSSLAPVGLTMAIMLVLGAIGEIPYFASIKPYLFTSYADLFQKAFDMPLDLTVLYKGCLALFAWAIAAFGISAFVFTRKDVLT